MQAGVSQRHLSFVESGRSRVGRDVLLAFATALQVPLRERNTLYLAAGYAPPYREGDLEAPEMAPVLRAVERVLQQQEPYPALLLDRYWNVLRVNDAAPRLFGSLVDLEAWPRPRNLLHLVFSPHGLRPAIANWQQVAAGLLQRVQREAVGNFLDDRARQLVADLEEYPGVRDLPCLPAAQSPVIPISFDTPGHRSSWFSLVTTLGTPQFVGAEELRIECMFPAD